MKVQKTSFLGMMVRFVNNLIFYAQDGTSSTCVKLRNSLIRNVKNCMYSVLTPKNPSHTGDMEAYHCDGCAEINDLMGEFWLFQWNACWWRLYAMVKKFRNIKISSIGTTKSFPRGRRASFAPCPSEEVNNNNNNNNNKITIDGRSESMQIRCKVVLKFGETCWSCVVRVYVGLIGNLDICWTSNR
jgi:hypothetical protein